MSDTALPDPRDRPIVAMTYSSTELEGFVHWRHMFRGLVAAGAVPIAIDCAVPVPQVAELVGRVDGLVISGGGDVSPDRYGGDPADPTLGDVNPVRDAGELAALDAARESGLPVFAICRGAQLVNVGLGGTLYADLDRDRPGSIAHRAGEEPLERVLHPVAVDPSSRLSRWLGGASELDVNSEHHQGLRDLASGLRATAWSSEGLVEAFEHPTEPLLAVQWHPEILWVNEPHALALMAAFTRSCVR